eukprot:g1308.t1
MKRKTCCSETKPKTGKKDKPKNTKARKKVKSVDIRPFWTSLSKKWSERLWACTTSGSTSKSQTFWNASSKKSGLGSWFSTKVNKKKKGGEAHTNHPIWNLISSKKKKPKKEGTKAIKVRVYPTPEQKKTLKKWFGVTRWTYNKCVEALRDKKRAYKLTEKQLRHRFMNKNHVKAWVTEVPYDVRENGLKDFTKARKSTYAKMEKRGEKVWSHFKFRSFKDKSESIVVKKKHWGRKRGAYAPLLGPDVLKGHVDLPEKLVCDSRLIRTRLGHYYLCMPKPLDMVSDNQAPPMKKHSTVALDPGVRTFMSGYDPDGTTFEWGKNDMSRVFRLCLALDRLQAKWTKVKHRQRYRMKIAARRIRLKIRNLVDEVHKKLSKWLCENYRCVVIPKFEVSGMVSKGKRKIASRTARAMCTWSHFRFRMRLMSKAREYPWCDIVETEEPYTSKTCGCCGEIHVKLGSSKTFCCPSCGATFDRDLNGARNILLRHLTTRDLRTEVVESTLLR